MVEVLERKTSNQMQVPSFSYSDSRLNIKVEEGCTKKCTYCAIPSARGRLRSYEPSDIINEINDFVKGKENPIIGLVGEDVGAYGLDIGTNIVRLLDSIYDVSGKSNFRVKVDVMNPWWFNRFNSDEENLLETLVDGTNQGILIPNIGLPLQSGSDRILEKMARKYTIQEYLGIVGKLRSKIPYFKLATDIIVGFPGETESDYKLTEEVIGTVPFSYYGMWGYSDRNNTKSLDFKDKVPHDIIYKRLESLIGGVLGLHGERGKDLISTNFGKFKQTYGKSSVAISYEGSGAISYEK